jgi:hypothetical protein
MNFYTPQEVARLVVKAGFWLEDLNDEMRVTARKTGAAGVSDQAGALAGLGDAGQRLAQRNTELERERRRLGSRPLVRLASKARRRRRGPRDG